MNNINEVIKKLKALEGLVAMGDDYDTIEMTITKLLKMEMEKLERRKAFISRTLINYDENGKFSPFLLVEKNKDYNKLWIEAQKVEHKIEYIKTMLSLT